MTMLMNWIMAYRLMGVLYGLSMAIIIAYRLMHKYGAKNVVTAIKENYRGSGQLGVDVGATIINATLNSLVWPVAYSCSLARVWNIVTASCENNRD